MAYRSHYTPALFSLLLAWQQTSEAFVPSSQIYKTVVKEQGKKCAPTTFVQSPSPPFFPLFSTTTEEAKEKKTYSFIDDELRGASMKRHTKQQAPKEGQAEASKEEKEPYITTHEDYLRYLVDSQHVYRTFEEIISTQSEYKMFRNTKMERTERLEVDIQFMMEEYDLIRPSVTAKALKFADEIKRISNDVPEFMCHYYTFYFAHTAGGRMIGKQMSAMLLNKKTLEFYKWDGDLNKIKAAVKEKIEAMAATWTREQKDVCVNQTPAAFSYGGGLMSNLSGNK